MSNLTVTSVADVSDLLPFVLACGGNDISNVFQKIEIIRSIKDKNVTKSVDYDRILELFIDFFFADKHLFLSSLISHMGYICDCSVVTYIVKPVHINELPYAHRYCVKQRDGAGLESFIPHLFDIRLLVFSLIKYESILDDSLKMELKRLIISVLCRLCQFRGISFHRNDGSIIWTSNSSMFDLMHEIIVICSPGSDVLFSASLLMFSSSSEVLDVTETPIQLNNDNTAASLSLTSLSDGHVAFIGLNLLISCLESSSSYQIPSDLVTNIFSFTLSCPNERNRLLRCIELLVMKDVDRIIGLIPSVLNNSNVCLWVLEICSNILENDWRRSSLELVSFIIVSLLPFACESSLPMIKTLLSKCIQTNAINSFTKSTMSFILDYLMISDREFIRSNIGVMLDDMCDLLQANSDKTQLDDGDKQTFRLAVSYGNIMFGTEYSQMTHKFLTVLRHEPCSADEIQNEFLRLLFQVACKIHSTESLDHSLMWFILAHCQHEEDTTIPIMNLLLSSDWTKQTGSDKFTHLEPIHDKCVFDYFLSSFGLLSEIGRNWTCDGLISVLQWIEWTAHDSHVWTDIAIQLLFQLEQLFVESRVPGRIVRATIRLLSLLCENDVKCGSVQMQLLSDVIMSHIRLWTSSASKHKMSTMESSKVAKNSERRMNLSRVQKLTEIERTVLMKGDSDDECDGSDEMLSRGWVHSNTSELTDEILTELDLLRGLCLRLIVKILPLVGMIRVSEDINFFISMTMKTYTCLMSEDNIIRILCIIIVDLEDDFEAGIGSNLLRVTLSTIQSLACLLSAGASERISIPVSRALLDILSRYNLTDVPLNSSILELVVKMNPSGAISLLDDISKCLGSKQKSSSNRTPPYIKTMMDDNEYNINWQVRLPKSMCYQALQVMLRCLKEGESRELINHVILKFIHLDDGSDKVSIVSIVDSPTRKELFDLISHRLQMTSFLLRDYQNVDQRSANAVELEKQLTEIFLVTELDQSSLWDQLESFLVTMKYSPNYRPTMMVLRKEVCELHQIISASGDLGNLLPIISKLSEEADNSIKKRIVTTSTQPRRQKRKLRSRNPVIDEWLNEDNGMDTFADLEDFIEV